MNTAWELNFLAHVSLSVSKHKLFLDVSRIYHKHFAVIFRYILISVLILCELWSVDNVVLYVLFLLCVRSSACSGSFQLTFKNFLDYLRCSNALESLCTLTHDKAEYLCFTVLILLYLCGICSQYLVNACLNLCSIYSDYHTLALCNVHRLAALFYHCSEHGLSVVLRYLLCISHFNQLSELLRSKADIVYIYLAQIYSSHKLAENEHSHALRIVISLKRILKEIWDYLCLDKRFCVYLRNTIFLSVSLESAAWHFRELSLYLIKLSVRKVYLKNIRFWEITIIVSVFLCTHWSCLISVCVVTSCFLNDLFACFKKKRLSFFLILDSSANRLDRVDVLYLRTSTKLSCVRTHKRDINVTSQWALLHFTVANACILQKQRYLLNESHSFFCWRYIRLSNYLDKRDTASVIVSHWDSVESVMNELTGVFLKVDMVYSDVLLLTVHLDRHISRTYDRSVKLWYLICLWQVRIEVVLSVEYWKLVDTAVERISCLYSILYSLLIDDRQSTRHTCTYRAASCIWRTSELSGAVTKDLSFGKQLGVDLKADDRSPFFHLSYLP